MAHAQRLAEQVKSANTRIKELEYALSDAQAQTGVEGPHPLLQRATAKNHHDNHIETSALTTIYDDDINEVSDAIGSLSIGLDGKARYHGETAGSEVRIGLSNPTYAGLPLTELLNSTYRDL
jgi:hypothetical protein